MGFWGSGPFITGMIFLISEVACINLPSRIGIINDIRLEVEFDFFVLVFLATSIYQNSRQKLIVK